MDDYLNPVTLSALLAWPVVALWLYKTRPIGRATLWTILGAYMLLPVGSHIKFPMIPDFDKSSIPNLAALFGCLIVCGRRPRFFSNGFGLAELLIAMALIGPFITSELNSDQIVRGPLVLPALGSYEAGSVVISEFVTLIPFFLGRQFLRNRTDTDEILRVLVTAGVIYSLPALFEIRFSPNLHEWIYGDFPYSFSQEIRFGGYRPVVFMGHGLLVSFFFCTTAIAAAALWRTNTKVMRLPAGGITIYLSVVLALCKTASSGVYGAVLVPLTAFVRPKVQLTVAVLLVSTALLYPMLRSAGLVPTEAALHLASSISSDREDSLRNRFTNENELLERGSQRFLFGWGRYGRSFIYDDRGVQTSQVDGTWIIMLGEFGLIGFLARFGLLALPVFTAASALRFAESGKDKVFLSALALILAVNIFDLLPNSPLRPWTWLIAGALLGRAEVLRRYVQVPKGFSTLQPVAHAETGNRIRVS